MFDSFEFQIERQLEYDETYDESMDVDIISNTNVPGEDDTQIMANPPRLAEVFVYKLLMYYRNNLIKI